MNYNNSDNQENKFVDITYFLFANDGYYYDKCLLKRKFEIHVFCKSDRKILIFLII